MRQPRPLHFVASFVVSAAVACASSSSRPGDEDAPPAGAGGAGGASGASGGFEAGGKADAAGSGGTPSGGANGGGGAAVACELTKPYSSKDIDCNACAEAKCCAEVNGCLDDPICDDEYVNCSLACALLPDSPEQAKIDACFADCDAQQPKGKKLYDAAIGCVEARCVGVCE